jgi:hypothetical protein
MKIIVGPVMVVDKPNLNHRIYPRAVFEKALKEYEEKYVKDRRALGELGVGETPTINLKNVSHMVTSFSWDGDIVDAEIEVLDTPQGKVLKDMLENGFDLTVVPRGIGSLKLNEETGVNEIQDDYEISSFDVIPSEQNSFRGLTRD